MRSAGLITKEKQSYFWNDANNNGEADEAELRPVDLPRGATTYHGQKWLADFSYVAVAQGSKDVLRLAPDGFDALGNPIFSKFTVLLTDPVFTARAKGSAPALFGGNELVDNFASDWAQADGSMAEGFYVQARGKGFNANHGAQHKISHYLPDGKGGYALQWRVGRSTFSRPDRGEMLGAMRLFSPINGLLTVVDQSRSGLLLYTADGLYVDTLFCPGEEKSAGLYALPGEFFAGTVYADKTSGKIYYASGKYTPLLHSMEGWSLKETPVRRLADLQARVTINASQIASPPEMALSLRGGAGKAQVARFYPALGGVAIDGSMNGWESAEAVEYSQAKDQSVEVRTLYDPEHLYLRYHVRLPAAMAPKPLPPLERLFTHDQASDTVSFYIQGDANAPAKAAAIGRPGDARFVFGLFKDGEGVKPAGVAMHPIWSGPNASPQVYRTPVGSASFAHVGAIAGAEMGHAIDPDKKGFTIAVSIPRSAIPAMNAPFDGNLRTLVNFDANLGGHNKFFWANTDGSASRETYDEPSEARLYPGAFAPALFQAIDKGVTLRQWSAVGPFGGPGAEKFSTDPREGKEAIVKFYNAASFPPDQRPLDFGATYQGDMLTGFWPDPKRAMWKPAQVAPLDTRVALGGGAQVWYAATWIYAPADTELELSLRTSPMVTTRWFLNDVALKVDKYDKDIEGKQTLSATKKVTLKTGWNQLSHRAFCVGYPPLRVGAVLSAPEATLWKLKFSGNPPAPAK